MPPESLRPTTEPRKRSSAASSITWRVFGGIAIIVGLVVLAALFMASMAARRAADASARASLDQSADLVAQLLAGRGRSLEGGARVFVQAPYFRTLVAQRRDDDILDQTFEAVEQLQAAWVFITDASGTLLAKSDEPSASGDALGQVALIANALRGQVSSGFGVSGDSLLFQIVAVPIAIPGGTPLGVLVATRVIDSALAMDIRSATASDVVFYINDRAGTTQVVVSTQPVSTALTAGVRQALAASAEPFTNATTPNAGSDARIDGETWMLQSAGLATAGGDVLGGFAVMRPKDEALATLVGVRRSLGVAAAFGLLLALLAAWFTARSVTRPVRHLAVAVQQAAEGNYEPSTLPTIFVDARSNDIGTLARAFEALLIDLRDKDSLSATAAAVVSTEESQRHAVYETSESETRRLANGTLAFNATTATPMTRGMIERGQLLAQRYRIESLLGSGSMGNVYRARDRALGETVAIKLLRPEIIVAEDLAREHFREEVRLTRRITHRNVVRIHDIGDNHGVPFLTMEYVEGASLLTVIRARGSQSSTVVLSLARQLMRALAAAHDAGVVHGDVKPSNILVSANGVLKVTDFGIARVVRAARRLAGNSTRQVEDVAGRLGGAVVGTPEYLAPELLIGGAPTFSSDLYAAGVVLHECLVGSTPFGAETPMAFLASKLTPSDALAFRLDAASATRAREVRDVPAAFESLLKTLTHPEPECRPADAHAVCLLLARIS